jgi:uncharacterized protein YjbI with pentapeptide repeats
MPAVPYSNASAGASPKGCVNPGYTTTYSSTNFYSADMTGANLAGYTMPGSKTYQKCGGGTFTPAATYTANLSNSQFSYAVLANTNLIYTKLPGSSNFTGSVWSNTTCPSGTKQSTPC